MRLVAMQQLPRRSTCRLLGMTMYWAGFQVSQVTSTLLSSSLTLLLYCVVHRDWCRHCSLAWFPCWCRNRLGRQLHQHTLQSPLHWVAF